MVKKAIKTRFNCITKALPRCKQQKNMEFGRKFLCFDDQLVLLETTMQLLAKW